MQLGSEFPEGWTATTLDQVTERVPNSNPATEPHREFGYVDIASIDNHAYQITTYQRFRGGEAPSRARRPIQAGDVLFSNVRTYLRNIALVPEDLDVQLCSTGFTVLRSNGAIEPQFLFRYLVTDAFIRSVTPEQTGTHYPATSDVVVLGQEVPLPPLAEQRRIAAKVEELLAQVNAVRERLEKVPAILKRFRQSLLADACEGRLTAEWREGHPNLEPASNLKDQILLQGRIARGNSDWIPIAPTIDPIEEVPDCWAKPSFDGLLRNDRSLSYGILKPGNPDPAGVPMLRVMDIGDAKLSGTDIFHVSPGLAAQYDRTRLEEGDVLLSVMATVGRTMVVPPQLAGANVNRALAVVKATPLVDPHFLCILIRSPLFQDTFAAEKIGSAQPRINLGDLKRFAVPLPPYKEQQEIVQRVETLLMWADAVERRVEAGLARVEKLTQAVLAKAFRGELVTTEAELARQEGRDYEPAWVLLERIRAERGSTVSEAKPSRGRRLKVMEQGTLL